MDIFNRRIAICLLTCGSVFPGALFGAQEPPREKLVVGTKQAEPFSFRGEDDVWRGISIDLWRRMAERLDLDYELEERSLEALIDGLEKGELDAAVAALTVTAEREKIGDFTHPFYPSGLGIAVPLKTESGFGSLAKSLFSLEFLQVVLWLALVISVAGILIWIFERRKNEQFHGKGGLASGFWWSAVTMTTVGYGDKAPVTPGGRGVAVVWMFASVIMISGFTAAIASSLTLQTLTSAVEGPDDLGSVDRVGTVAASTSEAYLIDRRISRATFPDVRTALAEIASGKLKAVVYDAPILKYLVNEEFPESVTVLPMVFERQDYAIGLPLDSPLRKDFNRALLEITSSDEWRDILYRYLGE
ncbi:MAG: transporter substrate-binding domain-containing protein [Planctomycetota bacterium]